MAGILLRVVTVASVNVAAVQTFEVGGKKLRSAILKAPVAGRVMVRTLGVDGDQQADHRFHGGPEKALYLYGAEHYDFWRTRIRGETLARLGGLPFGIFGENLTITGLGDLEAQLHVGDVLRIGCAVVELTVPRQPCWKLETRFGIPEFARAFLGSGRIGSYASVRSEGLVGAGDEVAVVERRPDAIPLAELILALYFRDDAAKARALASTDLPAKLRRRIEKQEHEGE
jgi:MOSC domain-containing protein YiiM